MQAIRSILVVIEPEHSESLALKRAKLIAGVTQAHLHLLVCDKSMTMPACSACSRPHCWLTATASPPSRPGTKASTKPSSTYSRRKVAGW